MQRTTLLRVAPAPIFAAALTGTVAPPAQAATVQAPKIVSVPIPGTIVSGAGTLTLKGAAALRASNTTLSCRAVGAQAFTLATAESPFVGHYDFLPQDPFRPGARAWAERPRPAQRGLQGDRQRGRNITGATAVALDSE